MLKLWVLVVTNDHCVYSMQVSYCGAAEQDLLCINERQVMVRSKTMYDQEPPNTSLEGVRADLDKRYSNYCNQQFHRLTRTLDAYYLFA